MFKWIQLQIHLLRAGWCRMLSSVDLFFKIRKYHRLVKKYGRWEDIPEGQMPQFFEPTPEDQNSQMAICMTFNEVAKLAGCELLVADSGELMRKWVNNDFDSIDEVDEVTKLIYSKNLNRDVINHFIECGDFTQRQLRFMLDTSPDFCAFYEGRTTKIKESE